MIPPKKSKLAASTSHARTTPSSAETWEIVTIDCEPVDLVPMVLEANDNDEGNTVIGLICGALKTLRNQKYRPDNVTYLGLLYLAKIRPSIFSNSCIVHGLSSLLKKEKDPAHNYKVKGNSLVPVLAANLLMRGYNDKKSWPIDFVRLYNDDALGDRVWVDHEECKGFVDNILTAFNTIIPPKSALQPEYGAVTTPRDCHSPAVMESDDNGTSNALSFGDKDKSEYMICPRYSQDLDSIEALVLEQVKEQLAKKQPLDTITRNFLKFLSSVCGFVEIRNLVVSRLESWFQNLKIQRPTQDLLIYLCYNCVTHTQRDVEVISQLVRIRLKTKAIINTYLNGIKELIGLHPDNLWTILKHTIYNELSTMRNPNNMSMLAVMIQTSPETTPKYLAEIFLELLLNREDYLRPLRSMLREIIRHSRHDLNLTIFAETLMSEKQEITQQLLNFDMKDRVFISIVDLLCLCMYLGIHRDFNSLTPRGDKRDLAALLQFQKLVSNVQNDGLCWLEKVAPQLYGIGRNELLHAMQKILLLESPDQYYKVDNWPPETERGTYMRLVSETPLSDKTLLMVLILGYSKVSFRR